MDKNNNEEHEEPRIDAETERLHTKPLTIPEVLDAFPEAKEIVPAKLKEREEDKKALSRWFNRMMQLIREEPEGDREVYRSLFKDKYKAELKNIQGHIWRLKAYLDPELAREEKTSRVSVENAKQTPILDVFCGLAGVDHSFLKRSGDKYFAICPFHEEKTPSFCLFVKDNRYHCFGCGESGDSISLVEKLKNIEFKEAIALLNKGA